MASSISTGDAINDMTTTDDEHSRLSRRSSVLNDLFSLFRRSSSFHLRSHPKLFLSDRECDEDEETDEEGAAPRISKDRVLELIQQKKEIIARLREQPWSMSRKRKALIVAQKHLKKQQAKVSKVQLIRTDISRVMKQFSRLFGNFKIYLIPWEAKIKRIESHYGSVVSSYFTFLRWVLGVNLMISLIMGIFVIVPEWLADAQNKFNRGNLTASIKVMPEHIRSRADSISTIVQLGGHFEYSLLFYGYYSPLNFRGETITYRIPLAYFLANIAIIALSFVWILRKMAENARSSKMSNGKTEQYVFNWKAFTGWDFTIGSPETATNVYPANVIKFREAIAEYNVKQKAKLTCGRGLIRVFTNLVVLAMLCGSVYAIYTTSTMKDRSTFWTANAVSITVSLISLIYPSLFDLMGTQLEKHHPKFALKLQLCRVLILYIVNYITLFFSLYQRLTDLEKFEASTMTGRIPTGDHIVMEQERLRNLSLGNTYYNTMLPSNSRVLRDLLMPLSNLTYSYSSVPIPPQTTPAPRRPWTTVLPDFGPFGVSAPRAVIIPNGRGQNLTSLFTAHAIGPNANWTSPAIIPLRFNGTNKPRLEIETTPHPFILMGRGGNVAQCWETVMGQEITNIVIMDMIVTIGSILVVDFLRGLGVRYLNSFWCWNLETKFPEYGEFKVAENVLHLANNQGMVWLGLFFVPLLPFINNIKLIIIMYIRGWACMTCNLPAKQIFRASKSNNFFLGLLLFMLFMSMIPFGFVIASKKPSRNCGPFAGQEYFYSVIANTMTEYLNDQTVSIVKAVISPGIIIPIIIFLLLVIYFLFSLVRGLREANDDLTTQLTHERTEEKKKIFELAGGKHGRGTGRGSIFFKFGSEKKKKDKRKIAAENDGSTKSLPRSITSNSNRFVPSLGSVSEVDHSSDSEGSVHGEKAAERTKSTSVRPESVQLEGTKLTLKQKILICIGLADPKKYERIPLEDLEAGPAEKGEEEKRQLLSGSSEEEGSASDEDEDRSYQTASQGQAPNSRADRSTTASMSRKYSKRIEIEYATPSIASPTTGESSGSSGSSETSNSRSAGYQRNPRYLEVANSSGSPSDSRHSPDLYPNHKSSFNSRSRKKSSRSGHHEYREPDESCAGDVSTRPPSQDGSFRDDAPAHTSSSEDAAQHLHSSYTSAMLSPIMARVVFPTRRGDNSAESDDERSDGAPIVPPHGHGEPATLRLVRGDDASRAYVTRPPRFRISSSPPKTPNSESRKFEVHVCSSPKTSRVRGRPPKKEKEHHAQTEV
ncbi:hypothetical protein PMAYCL1PPCAC_03701 [Pristionchus mayeri]|uniref:TMC domain-containing protein n=1 Tax=Pristionchus mayeri TaxID=1317129 RepID=A0AAN4Z6M5_9BILA|nr:hypothetical protein PMAYCL1PPCAC_03701 [Pristionchus mayeri]